MAFEHPGAAKYYEQVTFRRRCETHGAKLGSPLHFPSMNHEPHDSDEDFLTTKPALSDKISSCAEHRVHPESVSRPVKPELDEKAAKSPLIKRKFVDFSQNFSPVTHEQDSDQGGSQAVGGEGPNQSVRPGQCLHWETFQPPPLCEDTSSHSGYDTHGHREGVT